MKSFGTEGVVPQSTVRATGSELHRHLATGMFVSKKNSANFS